MRALDRHTIETLGVPGELLMESAGRAVAEAVLGAAAARAAACSSSAAAATTAATVWWRRATCTLLGVPVRAALLGERRFAARRRGGEPAARARGGRADRGRALARAGARA